MPASPAPARPRAIFLDVDGTYALHGTVPAAHVRAVRAARAAGHIVFLCTGRPVSLLSPHLLEAGFDGIVAGAGAHVSLFDADGRRETVLDVRFPAELSVRAVAALDRAGTHYLLETPEETFARPDSVALLAQRETLAAQPEWAHLGVLTDIVPALTPREDLDGIEFTKVTAFAGTLSMEQIAATLGPEVAVFPSSIADLGIGSGELYLTAITKATGLRAAIEHLGIAREDSIAFGDNLNDLEMIAYAGVGVAISSGRPEVIAVADAIADGPEDEGLASAFAELGLVAAP